ncbi:hypothetical protein Cfla_0750 [Cellulomonas flavigena DSM 20109]|uniref:Uncharacterized protein n=1 Tax=Cellulomonas flavigena (strain ATCC 482 / DSM 20109 / BCRC 11376 / JCM 18109 / NBRC 3775 / NCIMB 8073 / NRS 134) TaxID=446466 RepID=D5UJD8_CELFN|nr:hypothetical protein [Cellulomonas flavigena]ADG73661.1 hypothetical protein Cfla_0750 [Cellulomonas flavigena DSM 20109]
MPSVISTLLHPQRTPPPPIDVDLARVMWAGTTVWGAAVPVTGALWLLGVISGIWVATCGAGAVLGLIGVRWARTHGRLADDGSGAMVRPDHDALARKTPTA